MKRRIDTFRPFAFETSFQPAPKNDPEWLKMSTADLAALLAETREATAALVRDETLSAQTEHLQKISGQLRECLALIVNLAAHLESAAIDEHDRQNALANVRKLAQTLIAGQGELFTEDLSRSPVVNDSGGRS
ncbi:MAG: hypothetical protein AAF613_05400 [Pseudomonadota bacterium]